MDGDNNLTLKDVRSIANGRYNKKQGWKMATAVGAMLLGLLIFGVPAMVLGEDFSDSRVYESQWGEEVIVSGSLVTIEGMVLDRVDEPKGPENLGLKYFLFSLLLITTGAGFVYFFYQIHLQNKFIGDFSQKWVNDPMNLPEDYK